MAAERHGLLMPRPPSHLSLKQLRRMLLKVFIIKKEICFVLTVMSCINILKFPAKETGQILTCDLSRLTLDPVQPSSAKANWLVGATTRSTLTALHDLRLDSRPFP